MFRANEYLNFFGDFSRRVRDAYAATAIVSFALATELSSVSDKLFSGSIMSGAIAIGAESLRSFIDSKTEQV